MKSSAAMNNRNERRRLGLTEVNVLFVLLSFESFHAFAGEDRTPEDVVPLMQQLVRGILGVRPKPRR